MAIARSRFSKEIRIVGMPIQAGEKEITLNKTLIKGERRRNGRCRLHDYNSGSPESGASPSGTASKTRLGWKGSRRETVDRIGHQEVGGRGQRAQVIAAPGQHSNTIFGREDTGVASIMSSHRSGRLDELGFTSAPRSITRRSTGFVLTVRAGNVIQRTRDLARTRQQRLGHYYQHGQRRYVQAWATQNASSPIRVLWPQRVAKGGTGFRTFQEGSRAPKSDHLHDEPHDRL
jgi:hypothetical protein